MNAAVIGRFNGRVYRDFEPVSVGAWSITIALMTDLAESGIHTPSWTPSSLRGR